MIFERATLLWTVPVLAALVSLLALAARNRRWRSAAAWSGALGAEARRVGRRSPWLLGLVALLGAVALAGPRWGLLSRETESRALNAVIVMDISRSMLAEDAAPNRLERAAGYARRLVHDLEGDRLALVVFAARGYLMVPMTLDQSAVRLQLDALDPEIASEGGSGLASALELSRKLLEANTEGGDKAVVVFTDGESFEGEATLQSAGSALKNAGITLISVPVGDVKGARIPEGNGQFHRNQDGVEVITSRRDDLLKIVTDAAGGVLIAADAADPASAARRDLSNLTRATVTDRAAEDLAPRAWLFALAAAAILLAQAVTRRTASLIGLALVVGAAQAHAQRPAAGTRLLQRGDTANARAAFQRDAKRLNNDTAWYNVGTAAMLAGDYDEAIAALQRATLSLDPKLRQRALYNLGTTRLLQARKDPKRADSLLPGATEDLRASLAINPRDSNAKYNFELARRLTPPPPPPPPPSPQSGQGGGSGEKPPPQPKGGQGMTKAEADQVLNAMERAERATRQALNNRARQSAPPMGPDW